MARPLSPEKRQSILDAAAELIAAQGVGVSTAAIAKLAGVAEGTLFTYFPTKDDLLNELYLHLSRDLAGALTAEEPRGDAQARIAHYMRALIGWGVSNQVAHKAKSQLRASDRLSSATLRSAGALFQDVRRVVEGSLAGRVRPELMAYHTDSIFPGLAEITIEAILARPRDRELLMQACCGLFWKGSRA